MFISKLKDTTVLLRKQSLSKKHHAMINDLSSPIDYWDATPRGISGFMMRLFDMIPMLDEYSLVTGVNSLV